VKLTPIEQAMQSALLKMLRFDISNRSTQHSFPIVVNDLHLQFFNEKAELVLSEKIIPQCSIGPYRADFLILFEMNDAKGRVIIECDGHKWHTSSKYQVAYDRKRDRWFQANGFKVFRFTGHEIFNNAQHLAVQAWFACWEHMMREGAILLGLMNDAKTQNYLSKLMVDNSNFVASEKIAIESIGEEHKCLN